MYIPNDWYQEYEEFKKNELRGNAGIYDDLTDEQFEAVKGYFRWRTRQRFRELCSNTSLSTKPKKAEVLSGLMGSITDWVYDGCVDTGFLGASHCALGHALRYEHYAVSPSTGEEIIFGVNCASDFFGIEPDKLRRINTVQDEILEEIKFIVFIRNTGKHKKYFLDFYGDLMDIINTFRGKLDELFPYGWNQQMANFLRTKLPLTRAMVWRIEQVRNGPYAKKLAERTVNDNLIAICNGDPKALEYLKDGEANKDLHIVKVIMNAAMRAGEIKEPTEVKRYQALVRLSMQFEDTYNNLRNMGVADFKKFVLAPKEEVYYVKAAHGDRIATKGEIENKVDSLYTKEQLYLPDNQCKMLSLFGWGIFGDEKMYNNSGCPDIESDFDKIIKSGKLMAETLAWLNNMEELKRAMLTLKDHMDESSYPDSAEDEIKPDMTVKELVDFIVTSNVDPLKHRVISIAFSIAEKANYYNNYNLSLKQVNILRDAYALMTGKVRNSNSQQDNELGEVFKKINILLENRDHPSLQRHSFAFTIIDTVVKYGKVSVKQKKYIDDAYEDLVKSGALSEDRVIKKATVNNIFIEDDVDDSKTDINNGTNNIFIEGGKENKTIKDIDDIESTEEEYNVFIEGSKNNKVDWKTDVNAIIRMPSISEMSEALGTGVLKNEENKGDR